MKHCSVKHCGEQIAENHLFCFFHFMKVPQETMRELILTRAAFAKGALTPNSYNQVLDKATREAVA